MPRIVAVLERCKQRDVTQDYTYYGLASPWLQVSGWWMGEVTVRLMLAAATNRTCCASWCWCDSKVCQALE